jgi:hypothetical protein
MRDDYLDRDGLLALGLDSADVGRLLRDSPLPGHGGRAVVEADRLPDRLEVLREESSGPGPGGSLS